MVIPLLIFSTHFFKSEGMIISNYLCHSDLLYTNWFITSTWSKLVNVDQSSWHLHLLFLGVFISHKWVQLFPVCPYNFTQYDNLHVHLDKSEFHDFIFPHSCIIFHCVDVLLWLWKLLRKLEHKTCMQLVCTKPLY